MPEEHSSCRNMFSGRTSSKKRRPSFKEVEVEEIKACMCEVYKIDELKSSEIYMY